jgi:hypothetical protein
MNYADNYVEIISGFFSPPFTGEYQFYLSSNGPSQLWFSPNNASTTGLVEIATQSNWGTNYRSFFNNPTTQISAPQLLVEGNYYYFELRHDGT